MHALLACSFFLLHGIAFAARPQRLAALSASDASPPNFPESYQVSYNFTLPYTAKIQPHAISYPVTFWRDHHHRRFRIDTYNGVNSIINKKGYEYSVVPRVDQHRCLVQKVDSDVRGAGGGAGDDDGVLRALPDVRGWEFQGEESVNGQPSHLWVYQQSVEGKHVEYKFYATASGTPVRLHMHGKEMFGGAHFDEWVVDYTAYSPGRPDPSVFGTPPLCKGGAPLGAQQAQQGGSSGGKLSPHGLRMRSLLPSVIYAGDADYDSFLSSHAPLRVLSSLAEYRLRAETYRTNAALIAAHNAAPNRTYTLQMNRFGDWSREEFLAIMLPRHYRRVTRAAGSQPSESQQEAEAASGIEVDGGDSYAIPHTPLTDPSRVPGAVDWRGTGAVREVVKDQANCGSCWAFGATGAMEAAWYLATGQQESFSEQHLVDCSWDWGPNNGCDGGESYAAIRYAAATGGAALTQQYEYLGQDGFCRANSTRRVGRFKGYSRVPRYDTRALQEALYSRGPLAISLDASHPSFAFYSGGVYYEPSCEYRPRGLDHALVLVGYGTDDKQGDYWLIRNSWSDHWGDRGYIKVSRGNGGCGTATDAVYAVVEDAAA